MASSALIRASIAWPSSVMSALAESDWLPGRDAQLLLDEVKPGDELGHGVLHLEARVDLEEVVLCRVVEVGDELDRAGVDVAGGAGERRRLLAERPAQILVHDRRRRLLDNLLMSALQ